MVVGIILIYFAKLPNFIQKRGVHARFMVKSYNLNPGDDQIKDVDKEVVKSAPQIWKFNIFVNPIWPKKINLKYSKSNLEKLELLFKELEYNVRYEKGNFNSGYCVVEHKKIVVVNRFYDIEGRINILLDILSTLSIDEASLTEKSQQFFRQVAKNQENQLKELLQVWDCFF